MKHFRIIVLLSLLLIPAGAASAHGVMIEYKLTPIMALKIDLEAVRASGDALGEAGVAVFAPGTEAAPWLETQTDKSGHVSLMPDVQQTGNWNIRIDSGKQTALLRVPIQAGTVDLVKGIDIETSDLVVSYHLAEIPAVLVTLTARFESGDVMAGGQVTIYTPDNAKTPWLTGICDGEGRYTFIVDTTNLGTWEIQVRQAGHGEWVRIPIEENMVQVTTASGEKTPQFSTSVSGTSGGTGEFSPGQIVLMIVSVVWGLIGTALYVSSRRRAAKSDQTPADDTQGDLA